MTASIAGVPPAAPVEAGSAAGAGPPAIPGARCSPETLEPLGETLEDTQRLAVAEDRVARTLAVLPTDRWLVERYVLLAGHRIPFLILGEKGVFAVWPATGPPMWEHLPIPSHVAAHVKETLPGYAGPVQGGLCQALASSEIEPRWWCRPGEPGTWVMGLEWLIGWLEHFGPEHGLGVKDIERLRELAKPKSVPRQPVPEVVPDIG